MEQHNQELAAVIWPPPASEPTRLLTCRHCGAKNRIPIPTAVLEPESCSCGSCKGALFLGRDEPLTAISSTAYEHSLDRRTLNTLKAVPGFPKLLRWMLANVSERGLHLLFMASAVSCGDDQFPELVELMDRARHRLDIPYRPSVYLSASPFLNAAAAGVEDPAIVVQSAILDVLDDDEVIAIMAHELGHLHADHSLYRAMASLVLAVGRLHSPLLATLSLPVQFALLRWVRHSELTADRAALLGARDLPLVLGMQLKLAAGLRQGVTRRTNLQLTSFIKQARELEHLEDKDWRDGIIASMLAMKQTHPFAAWRVMHLLDWVSSGNYLDILAGDHACVVRE